MSILSKAGLFATALICCFNVSAQSLNSQNFDRIFLKTHSHIKTHIIELKPIHQKMIKMAASKFLPDYAESQFSNYQKLDNDYNNTDCKNTDKLFTTKNCTYPKALISSSKCTFKPKYYKSCECLPQFKIKSCPSPKIPGSEKCDGAAKECVCPATVSLTQPNDKCTNTCEGRCIAKTCTPTPNESGCIYGQTTTSDGCGGARTVCKPCNLTPCSGITDKPANSYYTTSSCTDCGGTKTINSGWQCNNGYVKSGNSCISSPSCPSGYVKMDNYCVNPMDGGNNLTAEKCKSMGYKVIWGNGTNGCGGHYQKYYIVPEWNCPYNISYGSRGCGVCGDIPSDNCYSSHAGNVDYGKGSGRTDFIWGGEKCNWAK